MASRGRSLRTWNAIRYTYMDAHRYAERQGLILKGTEKIWDSSIANIGILWVAARDRRKLPQYLEAVYPPCWRRELDIEDVQVVAACLERAGVDADGFADFQAGEGRRRHDELRARFQPNGIYGVLCGISGNPIDYIRVAFSAYWDSQRDLNSAQVVRDIIETSGASYGGELSTALDSLGAAQQHAEAEVIVHAPAYVIDGQIFIGRQHLPWIEEIARSPT